MASPDGETDPTRAGTGYAMGLAIGLGAGVALGTALGNLALGIALGAGVGLTLGAAFERQRRDEPLTPMQRRLLVLAVVVGLLVALVVVALTLLG